MKRPQRKLGDIVVLEPRLIHYASHKYGVWQKYHRAYLGIESVRLIGSIPFFWYEGDDELFWYDEILEI